MWDMLSDRLFEYFRYEASSGQANAAQDVNGRAVRPSSVHPGALFQAMQHHCGVRFADNRDYDFFSSAVNNPLPLNSLREVVPRVHHVQVPSVQHLDPSLTR